MELHFHKFLEALLLTRFAVAKSLNIIHSTTMIRKGGRFDSAVWCAVMLGITLELWFEVKITIKGVLQ
jgi:hypothetical protein